MNDAYNLTWKLSLILRKLAKPSLLSTYQTERQHIAKQLINFDQKFSHLFASPEKLEDPEFHDVYLQNKGFTSGCGHQYPATILTDEETDVKIDGQALDPLTPGKRLLPVNLTRHINGNVTTLLDGMPSIGHFHIFAFAGDLLEKGGLDGLSMYLTSSASPLAINPSQRSTTHNFLHNPATDPDTIIDLYLIHTSPHLSTPIESLPPPFPQWHSTIYEDVGGKAHRELGIDVNVGALVVVRPDGYVGLVTRLDNGERAGEYLDGIFVDKGA